MHFWLRFKAGYARWRGPLLAVALLVPVFALFGVWTAGQEVIRLAEDPAWSEKLIRQVNFPSEEQIAFLYRLADFILLGLVVALLATLVGRYGWIFWRKHIDVQTYIREVCMQVQHRGDVQSFSR